MMFFSVQSKGMPQSPCAHVNSSHQNVMKYVCDQRSVRSRKKYRLPRLKLDINISVGHHLVHHRLHIFTSNWALLIGSCRLGNL
jgi:hypothetical protein